MTQQIDVLYVAIAMGSVYHVTVSIKICDGWKWLGEDTLGP